MGVVGFNTTILLSHHHYIFPTPENSLNKFVFNIDANKIYLCPNQSLWQPYDYASLNIKMTPMDFQYGFTVACYE